MRRIVITLLCSILLAGGAVGCGNGGKKNANSGRDMPRPAESH